MVIEEGEVVMEVKQVMVAEVEAGGEEVSCQGEGGECVRSRWGTWRYFQMWQREKWDGW